MTIERARELIGETNIKYSDAEILQLIEDVRFLADVVVEKIKKMTPKEIKKLYTSKDIINQTPNG